MLKGKMASQAGMLRSHSTSLSLQGTKHMHPSLLSQIGRQSCLCLCVQSRGGNSHASAEYRRLSRPYALPSIRCMISGLLSSVTQPLYLPHSKEASLNRLMH